ncbi:hypothetical protein Agub_g6099 [Astrephomene gubernaculifera]|uniref:phytol kinase n=1 Tax=Astrephomene gubernaculifera TaxID=47775 RepID=A0AAD3DQB9_9CHLO|nr:hypothetical protein Agub_g6099 [Astrephomene gubernaculifera]
MSKQRSSARGMNYEDSGGSNTSGTSAAGSLPSSLRSRMRRLPADAERMLSGHTVNGLRQEGRKKSIMDNLFEVSKFIQSPPAPYTRAAVAAAVLADAAVRSALLRLLAARLRLAPDQLQSDPARKRLALVISFPLVVGAVDSVLLHATHPAPPQVADFALKLLRMQTLQALCREIATVAAHPPAAQANQGAPNGLQVPPERRARELQVISTDAAFEACHMVFAMASFAIGQFVANGASSISEDRWRALDIAQFYCFELAAALRDSGVLEQAAKQLLVAEEAGTLALLRHARNPTDVGEAFTDAFISINMLAEAVADLSTVRIAAAEATAAMLREVLSGRCAQHAAVVHGLAALCTADGGPSYSLPSELLARVPVSFTGRTVCHAARPCRVLQGKALIAALHALGSAFRAPPPPGRRASLALMKRISRLAVASGQIWADEAKATPGAAAAAASSASSGGGSAAEAPAAGMSFAAILESISVVEAILLTLQGSRRLLGSPQAGGAQEAAQWRQEEGSEWWRLVGGFVRHAAHLAREAELNRFATQVVDAFSLASLEFVVEEPLILPAAPPPSVAAALAGGFLPCLERLLRRAGKKPVGSPEAVLTHRLLANREVRLWLPALLVYGEERQAAALVVTIGKLMRQMDPWDVTVTHHTASFAACRFLCIAVRAFGGAETPFLGAAGATGAPAPLRQLLLMASIAQCEWLQPLSRLVQNASRRPDFRASNRWVADVLGKLLEWTHVLSFRCMWEAGMTEGALPGSRSRSQLGGSGTSAPTKEGGDGGWRRLLLEELDVVRLLGACLLMPESIRNLPHLVMCLCCGITLFPEQVRQAAVAGGPGGGWRSERLLALVPELQEADEEADAEGASDDSVGMAPVAEAIAEQLERWRAEAKGAGGPSTAASSSRGQGPMEEEDDDVLAWMRAVLRLSMQEWFGGVGTALVSPAELRLRGLVRGCGNPGCTSLAGDSEAEVKLMKCGRCGTVGYCCRDCQAAHWKAGHKEACRQRCEG